MVMRPRRLRRTENIRALVEEVKLNASDFVYPMFVIEGSQLSVEIDSMPGIFRWSIDLLLEEIQELRALGIKAIALFPVIDASKKNSDAKESFNPDGLTQRTVSAIKERFPDLVVITDIALDPYTDHGHDGLIEDGKVLNDETVEVLVKMALAQAEAGADIVAPSDMMDGRVLAIREALNASGYTDVSIMAYTAKYASCFYAPFRDALASLGSEENTKPSQSATATMTAPELLAVPQDKKTYQMNPANSVEAMRELELDLSEGADFVMVKPASFYLDIVHQFKENSTVPVAAYQVSGEYAMLKCAANNNLIDMDKAMLESLISIKRAGADLILTYFAKEILEKKLL